MSHSEILAELPRMTIRERREILERLLELETEAEVLRDADRRADERFLMLDELEAHHGPRSAG